MAHVEDFTVVYLPSASRLTFQWRVVGRTLGCGGGVSVTDASPEGLSGHVRDWIAAHGAEARREAAISFGYRLHQQLARVVDAFLTDDSLDGDGLRQVVRELIAVDYRVGNLHAELFDEY